VSVSWVDAKENNEVWAHKCFCGTSPLSWMPEAEQVGVESAFCAEYDSAWGWAFLIVAIGGAALYVGIGVARASRAQGGNARLRLHPHYARWVEVRGLALDGMRFSQQRVRGGRISQPRQAARGQPDQTKLIGSDSDAGSGESRPSKSSSKKKSAKHKGRSDGTHVAKAAATAAASSTAAATTLGSASGGGGRWVHVGS
jgi:hypothetical protein